MLGPQQVYLTQVEHKYVANSPVKNSGVRRQHTVEMSPADKIKSIKGELNQANYLIQAKERNSEKKQLLR